MPDCTFEEASKLSGVEGSIIPGGWSDEKSPELTVLIQKLDKEDFRRLHKGL